MKKSLQAMPFLLVAVLIFCTQHAFMACAVWNCIPLGIAYVAFAMGLQLRGASAVGAITFSVVATVLPALFHLAWLFDWAKTASGSSTSALAFIFLPIWVVVLAVIASGLAYGAAKCFYCVRQ